MKRIINSDIGVTILWLFSSLMLAAILFPWLYQAGQYIAQAGQHGNLPSWLEWLGKSCDRARSGRYFNRSVMISTLLLLPLLFHRIKKIRKATPSVSQFPLTRLTTRSALQQLLIAATLSASILWFTGMLLGKLGAFELDSKNFKWSILVTSALLPAIGASLLEEWLFRGVLLGLWLRATRPLTACIGCSLVFSFLHFLQPLKRITDPTDLFAGFDVLGKILLHFTDPLFFVTDFATLTLIGLILAWSRIRTGSLWFPIGLHFGWVIAYKSYSQLYENVPNNAFHPWGVGDDLRAGIIPLLTLVITAIACRFVFQRLHHPQPATLSESTDCAY